MAQVPIWVFAGELITNGNVRAERPGFVFATDYREDAVVASQNPRFSWPDIHSDAGGLANALVWNHHGVQFSITSIADNGDGTSRVTLATGHGRTSATFPVVLCGIIRSAGTDLQHALTLEATLVDATRFDVPISTIGGAYTYTSTLVTAAAGRTIQFWEPESPTHPGGPAAGRGLIRASSGDFIADGFRRSQDLVIVDTISGTAAFSGTFTILSVTATDLVVREVVGAWEIDGGPYSSGITLQGKAICKTPSFDFTSNPLIGPGWPNSHTQEEVDESQVYPSETHGAAAMFQAICVEQFEGAGLTDAKLFGTGNNFRQCFQLSLAGGGGPFGGDHAKSYGIDSIEIAVGKTLLHLEKAHGLVGSERVFVYGIPSAQTPSLTGYHLATVEDADTLSIPITSTAVPNPSVFRGAALGTVSLRDLVPASAAIVAETLEITTATAHGLTTGDQVWIGGVVGHQPDDINGRWRVTVIDSDTFSIPLRTTVVSPTIGNGWISTKFRQSKVYSCGANPIGGGQMWDRNALAIRSCFDWIDEKTADVPFVAGVILMGGYNDDNDSGGNIAGLGGQVERYGRTMEELVRDLREEIFAAETGVGATQHATAADIPVMICAYNPNLTPNPGDPSRTIGGKLFANVLSLRAQANSSTSEIGGKVAFYDPNLDGFQTTSGYIFPTIDTLFRLGEAFWRTWRNLWLGVTVAGAAENRAPLYILIGQSQTVGTIQGIWCLLDGDPNYDGSHYDPATGKVRPGSERQSYIWNSGAIEFQEYTTNIAGADGNAATHPIHNALQSLNFGPEASGILKVRERHPEGVYMVKLAVGSSALAPVPGLPTWDPATGTLYNDLLIEVRRAYRWLIEERGLVPDLRGIVFHQGESDSLEPYASEYETRLTAFIAQLRADVGTRSSAEPATPFVIGGLNVHERFPFNLAAGQKVQAAQQAVAAADAQVGYADLQSITIKGSDDTHYTGEGTIEAGLRMFGSVWYSLGTYLAPKVEEFYLKDQEFGSAQLGSGESVSPEGSTPSTPSAAAETSILQGTTAVERAREIIALCDQALAESVTVLSWTAGGKQYTRQGLNEIIATKRYYEAFLARHAGYTRSLATFGGS